eukprot:COSAG02_NODE_7567_length_2958_cov_2.231200_1_plen_134_part_00
MVYEKVKTEDRKAFANASWQEKTVRRRPLCGCHRPLIAVLVSDDGMAALLLSPVSPLLSTRSLAGVACWGIGSRGDGRLRCCSAVLRGRAESSLEPTRAGGRRHPLCDGTLRQSPRPPLPGALKGSPQCRESQ